MRRLRHLIQALELEFGVLAESERGSIQQLANIQLLIEQMQPGIVEGRCTDADQVIRLSGERRRLLQDLRAKAAQREPEGTSVDDIFAAPAEPEEPEAE
jgi:hypothetical protein